MAQGGVHVEYEAQSGSLVGWTRETSSMGEQACLTLRDVYMSGTQKEFGIQKRQMMVQGGRARAGQQNMAAGRCTRPACCPGRGQQLPKRPTAGEPGVRPMCAAQ